MKNCSKIVWLVLLLVATSCTVRKKMVQPERPQSFEWLTAKMDIEAQSNEQYFNDLSGQLRMRKDSIIWLNVTATMGMEVLRVKISNDSVWILNRLEKSYLSEPLDIIAAQLGIPVSLPLVQALLLDNNDGIPPVENQTVQLKTFVMGELSAKVRYTNIKLDEETTFPLKITDKMERIKWVRQQ